MTKPKSVRDQIATDKLKNKIIEQSKTEQMRIIRMKHNLLNHMVNGNYFLARANMLARCIKAANEKQEEYVAETESGVFKTVEYATAEFALFKMRAMRCMRDAHFGKRELLEKGVTAEEISKVIDDHYNGPVKREKYDEEMYNALKAEFVPD